MKRIFSRTGIAGVALVVLLAVLAACETPTSGDGDEGSDGPEDGTPWTFENQSSYDIRIYPDNDEPHSEQGWDVFSLPEGEEKTVRVSIIYPDTDIYFAYNHFEEVDYTPVQSEHRITFTNK